MRPVLETAEVLKPSGKSSVPGFRRLRVVMGPQSGNDCSLAWYYHAYMVTVYEFNGNGL
jgi:hypothetical protein